MNDFEAFLIFFAGMFVQFVATHFGARFFMSKMSPATKAAMKRDADKAVKL